MKTQKLTYETVRDTLVALWLLALVALLVGCETRPSLGDFRCTEAQMARVESETRFCNEQTDYFGSDCYLSAIRRNCEPTSKDGR